MDLRIAAAFFIVAMCVIVPFLRYYARKNPDPRFRPRFGEMVLVTVLAVGLCGGGSVMMAGLLGVDFDPKKLERDAKVIIEREAQREASLLGDDEEGGDGGGDKKEFKWPWEEKKKFAE